MQAEMLYKRDKDGRIRGWCMEQEGDRYRSVSGLLNGERVFSGWTVAQPTNVGKKNERNAEQQAEFEIKAEYKKKLAQGGYFSSIAETVNETYFEPMLAQTYKKWPSGFVYTQPKLDGIRCIARASGLWSRKGKSITGVPHVHEALKPFFAAYPTAVLDGELYNHELKDQFEQLVSLIRKGTPVPEAVIVQYHIYDMPVSPWLPNEASFGNRTASLQANWKEHFGNTSLVLVETDVAEDQEMLNQFYGVYLQRGYEGQMVRLDVPYEVGTRSKGLLKRKEFQDKEFKVVDIQPGLGNWAGAAKSILCELEDGRTFGAGYKGTYESAAQLLAEKDAYVGRQATIRYFTPTADGIPRFPVAHALHREERL